MSNSSESDFQVRPEVADLYEISFILCGMFFCERCSAPAPQDGEVKQYSNLAYYRTAELAHARGWRPAPGGEYQALCAACITQQDDAGDAQTVRA